MKRLLVLMLLLVACATATKEEALDQCVVPAGRAREGVSIVDFQEFAGLRLGSTRSDVQALLGEPEFGEVDDGIEFLSFLNGGLDVAIETESERVRSVLLSNRYALVGAGLEPEKRAQFLWSHASDVIETFGMPTSASSNNYEYEVVSDQRYVGVTFVCYDFNGCLCSAIQVLWDFEQ